MVKVGYARLLISPQTDAILKPAIGQAPQVKIPMWTSTMPSSARSTSAIPPVGPIETANHPGDVVDAATSTINGADLDRAHAP